MAAKDADLASPLPVGALYLVDDLVADFELGEVASYEQLDGPVEFYLVELGALSAEAEPVDPGPPVLSELDTDQGGIGFGIRTTKARG